MNQDLEDWSYYSDECRDQISMFTHDCMTAVIQGGTAK